MKLIYRQMRVLLVEPSGPDLDALASYIKDFNFSSVLSAHDVEEAWAVLGRKPVDLVIASLQDKPGDGFSLLERVTGDPKLARLPVLLLIDRRNKELEKRAAEMGAAGFVNLPLDRESVQSTVIQVLEPFIDPNEEEFLQQVRRGRKALDAGETKKAIEAFKLAIEAKPNPDLSLLLAGLLFKGGDLPGAEAQYTAVVEAEPLTLKAYLGLASVYQALGRPQDALTVLNAALAAARRIKDAGGATATILLYLGEIELTLKHLSQARGYFSQACELDPENRDLRVRIGDTLAGQGFAAEAEPYYREALKLDPEVAHVYNRLGITYRKQGKHDLALKLYQRALAFHPEDEHLRYNTARCLCEMGDYDQAADYLAEALKLNPGFSEARKLLDLVFAKMGPADTGGKRDQDS